MKMIEYLTKVYKGVQVMAFNLASNLNWKKNIHRSTDHLSRCIDQ